MKMMNCLCDDDDDDIATFSSSGSPQSSSSPSPYGISSINNNNGTKVKSTNLFMKTKPAKVQRSASAIIRSKMYQVIKKKKKPKENLGKKDTVWKLRKFTLTLF